MADGLAVPAPHGLHDRLLVAAESDRTAGTALGRALLAACTECARLHADLVALASALPSAATPRRTRDFTLTAADAERLRRRGLRRWLAGIGSPRDTLSRPLAIGFTTLGLAGLLVATVPSVLPMASGGAAGASTAPTIELQVSSPAPSAEDVPQQGTAGGRDPGVTSETPIPQPTAPAAATTDQLPVVVLSGVFLTAGAGLSMARRRARVR